MHQLAEVEKVWKELKPKLRAYAEMRVVGSVRRRIPSVKDVDIIVIPASKDFISSIKENLQIIAAGEKRISGKYQGIKFDFFICDCHTWGANLIWWTGPKRFNIALAKRASKNGWIMSNKGLRDSKGNVLEVNELQILEKLNMGAYFDPRKRR
jgi:DNA polymerase/3'-5' exonuclease PolX